jgi:hypothetical protein
MYPSVSEGGPPPLPGDNYLIFNRMPRSGAAKYVQTKGLSPNISYQIT